MTFVIGAPCIDVMDRSCVEECPVDAIYEGARMMYIHPRECIDCGACDPVCPTEAIVPDRRMPDAFIEFRDAAQALFDNEEYSGGGSALGLVPDPPMVSAR
ncbi:ferredoxin [Nocardioides sp. Bht2]|uniref:ferredoxin n=1 Tax=Nocardioides sp. Bht2 TaxID=3392297 RepID=UPI0039B51F13